MDIIHQNYFLLTSLTRDGLKPNVVKFFNYPSSGLELLGQSSVITLGLGKELRGTFSLKDITHFKSSSRPCEENFEYSFSQCLTSFVEKRSNCTIHLPSENGEIQCSFQGFQLYQNYSRTLKQLSYLDLIVTTGCQPKCRLRKFIYEEKSSEEIVWKHDWISAFYLEPKTVSYTKINEHYLYQLEDFIGDFGSYLGLFLGWSLVSVCSLLVYYVRRIPTLIKERLWTRYVKVTSHTV